MSADRRGFTARTALIVALGGFLMGFDASVISGVVGFIELEFALSKLQLGWSVASLALAARGRSGTGGFAPRDLTCLGGGHPV